MCLHYYAGVEGVKSLQKEWNSLEGKIDSELFGMVKTKLGKQEKLAEWWRDSCVLYFQQYSKKPLPDGLERPAEKLEYYQKFDFSDLE